MLHQVHLMHIYISVKGHIYYKYSKNHSEVLHLNAIKIVKDANLTIVGQFVCHQHYSQ